MDYISAFLIGGSLCAIAQIIIDKTKLTPARILVSYVCFGVFFTGIGWYEKLVEFAHCGATVPLMGFGYCLANGVKEAVENHGFYGILTGGLTATSSGITAVVLFSLLFSFFSKGNPENI